MRNSTDAAASFDTVGTGHSRIVGSLAFGTVTRLLPTGSAAIASGQAAVIDLKEVTGSDSAGLALLIEWLSVARMAGKTLRYENVPTQLQQLARLSDVEDLLVPK